MGALVVRPSHQLPTPLPTRARSSPALDGCRPAKKARIYDDTGKWNGKCSCGAKAKKRTAKRPGPNCGREFWCARGPRGSQASRQAGMLHPGWRAPAAGAGHAVARASGKQPSPAPCLPSRSCGKYTATGGAQCDFFQWA